MISNRGTVYQKRLVGQARAESTQTPFCTVDLGRSPGHVFSAIGAFLIATPLIRGDETSGESAKGAAIRENGIRLRLEILSGLSFLLFRLASNRAFAIRKEALYGVRSQARLCVVPR